MNISLFEIFIIVSLGFIMTNYKNNYKTRKLYIIIVISILWFIGSMRSNKTGLMYGADTMSYCNGFYGIMRMSWEEVKNSFITRYYYGYGQEDLGYTMLVKIISLFTDHWNIFSFIAQSLFFIPFGVILYRFSKNIYHLIFAFVFYVALIQTYILYGGRQLYAVGICMISFIYVIKNKYKTSLVLIAIACTIHMSSLLFLGPLILSKFDFLKIKRVYFLSFFAIILVLTIGGSIVSSMGNIIGIDRYSEYISYGKSSGYTFFVMLEMLSLFCYQSFRKYTIVRNLDFVRLYSMLPFVTFFAGFITINPSLQRTALYFYIYMAVLFPIAIDLFFKSQEKKNVYILVILLLSFMVLKTSDLEYNFFWQESQISL